jgi:hypothetical protein
MSELADYIRAYRAYVSTKLGWGRAIVIALAWLAGMFAPMAARTLVTIPDWMAISWMIVWSLLGYVFAPYGMWRHNRAQAESFSKPNRK